MRRAARGGVQVLTQPDDFQTTRIRALEASELLLSDFRDHMNPEQYARAVACARRPLSAIHPEQAKAILRMFMEIAGDRK